MPNEHDPCVGGTNDLLVLWSLLGTVQPSEEEKGERGAIKRLSTMWSSFRGKHDKDREYKARDEKIHYILLPTNQPLLNGQQIAKKILNSQMTCPTENTIQGIYIFH